MIPMYDHRDPSTPNEMITQEFKRQHVEQDDLSDDSDCPNPNCPWESPNFNAEYERSDEEWMDDLEALGLVGFTIAATPLFAERTKYFPLSIALKIL